MKRIVIVLLLGLLAVSSSQAQMVGANSQRESLKEIPEYRPTGGFLQIEIGGPYGIAVGTQLTSAFMIGVGTGYAPYLVEWERNNEALPLFVQMRLGTPKYNFSVFADLKLGVDLMQVIDPDHEFFTDRKYLRYPFGMVQVGVAWRDLSIGFGWTYMYDEYKEYRYEYYRNELVYYKSGLHGCFTVTFDYRLTFNRIRRILW